MLLLMRGRTMLIVCASLVCVTAVAGNLRRKCVRCSSVGHACISPRTIDPRCGLRRFTLTSLRLSHQLPKWLLLLRLSWKIWHSIILTSTHYYFQSRNIHHSYMYLLPCYDDYRMVATPYESLERQGSQVWVETPRRVQRKVQMTDAYDNLHISHRAQLWYRISQPSIIKTCWRLQVAIEARETVLSPSYLGSSYAHTPLSDSHV